MGVCGGGLPTPSFPPAEVWAVPGLSLPLKLREGRRGGEAQHRGGHDQVLPDRREEFNEEEKKKRKRMAHTEIKLTALVLLSAPCSDILR